MSKKHPNITNLDEVAAKSDEKGRFGYHSKRLGAPSGAKSLGCSWFEISPGKTAFPQHYHCANEEAIFILEGNGEVRIDNEYIPVEKGDYIAFPIGPKHAHALKNIGTTPLRYLCMSTLIPTEVVGYPDSKKIMFVGGEDVRLGFRSSPYVWLRGYIPEQPSIDYYEGEDIGEERTR